MGICVYSDKREFVRSGNRFTINILRCPVRLRSSQIRSDQIRSLELLHTSLIKSPPIKLKSCNRPKYLCTVCIPGTRHPKPLPLETLQVTIRILVGIVVLSYPDSFSSLQDSDVHVIIQKNTFPLLQSGGGELWYFT